MAVAFILFPGLLQNGVDGENYLHWAQTNFALGSSVIDISVMNPFQGLAGLSQPLAVSLHPAYLAPRMLGSSWHPLAASYLSMGLAFAASLFFLARAAKVPMVMAIIGAQLVTVLSLSPFWAWHAYLTRMNGVHLYSLVGGLIWPVALGMTALGLLMIVGTRGAKGNIGATVGIVAVLLYSIAVDPLYTFIFGIAPAAAALGVISGSESRTTLRWRLGAVAAAVVTLLLLKVPWFYSAILGYQARSRFPNELYVEVQRWDNQTGLIAQSWVAFGACVAILMCAFAVVRLGNKQSKWLAGTVSLFMLMIAIVSALYVYSGKRWHLPAPVYFEVAAHPLYAVVALMGITLLVHRWTFNRTGRLNRLAQSLVSDTAVGRRAIVIVSILPVAFTGLTLFMFSKPDHREFNMRAEPTARGQIVAALDSGIGINLPGPFRGSVALLVGLPGSPIGRHLGFVSDSLPHSKENISQVPEYLRRTFDDALHLTGLWSRGIPTIEDNNHLVTPAFHFFYSRLLSRSHDYHSRNWVVVTRMEPRILAGLGCRFLITDEPQRDTALTLVAEQRNADGFSLFLYELWQPNLATYSPTTAVFSRDAPATVVWLRDPAFSLRDSVIVTQHIPGELVPVAASTLVFERGGIRIRAASSGTSLLVLPVQYSHSLTLVERESPMAAGFVRTMRANLVQTGVLFSGEIDVKLNHRFGLFRGVDGRRKDLADVGLLNIVETGDMPYPDHYQPHALR